MKPILETKTKTELIRLAKIFEAEQKFALRTLFFYLSQLSDEKREEFIRSVFYDGKSTIDLTI